MMQTAAARGRRLRRLARATFTLAVLVVAASAYLRLSAAGLGCTDWPACYGRVLGGATYASHAPWEGARLVHRLVATLALLAGILLCWRAWRPWPLQPAARYAGLLLLLMLFLSVVGVWSADPRQALVNFINLVGGLGLVSFSWRVAITAVPSPAPAAVGPLYRVGFAALTATVLLGALIGARYAATACAGLPDCQGAWWPAGGWSALHPFVTLAGPAGAGDVGGVALHLLHRYFAVLAALLLAALARRAWPRPEARPAAIAVLALLGLEAALGVLTVASGFGLGLAVAHNVGAALLLAAAASLMRRAA